MLCMLVLVRRREDSLEFDICCLERILEEMIFEGGFICMVLKVNVVVGLKTAVI